MGDLLSDEDEDSSNKNKKSDTFKSNVSESSGKQDLLEPRNKQNKAKVIADLFGLEEDKKVTQQPQSDRDFSSSWLGLKESLPAENKAPEIPKAASKTPEHGIVQF